MRAAALALILAAAPFAAQAQDDRSFLEGVIEDSLSSAGREVRVEGFAGALSSRATVERLTIADEGGVWLTLAGVTLDWSRAALLSGRVEVAELVAQEIRLDRLPAPAPGTPPAPEAGGFALPELPVSLALGRVAAERIVLGAPVLGEPVEARIEASARLEGGAGELRLTLARTDDAPATRLELSGAYANATTDLTLSLTAEEAAGGLVSRRLGLPGAPSLALSLAGEGRLADFVADLTLATDGEERLEGRLRIAPEGEETRFAADLAGDLAPLFAPEHAAFLGPEIDLRAEGRRDALGAVELGSLVLTARSLRAAGSLRLAPGGAPERAALTLALADPAGGAVLLPLPGDPVRLGRADLAVELAPGGDWALRGTVEGLETAAARVGRLALDGSGRFARAYGSLGGHVALAAEGLAPADPALARALGPVLRLDTLFHQAGGELSLSRLMLAGEGLAATGRLRIADPAAGLRLAGALRAEVADLSRLADVAGRPGLAGAGAVELSGEGSPLAGDADLTLRVEGARLALGLAEVDGLLAGGPVTLAAAARRDATGVTLRELRLAAPGVRAEGAGRLATAGSDLTGRVELPELARTGAGRAGALTLQGRVQGRPGAATATLTGAGRDLAAGVAALDGLLAGATTLDLALTQTGERVEIARADIGGPRLRLTLSGAYAPGGSDLAATLALPDLAATRTGVRGAVEGRARLTGTPADGALTLDLTGRNLALGQPELDRLLAGEARLDVALGLAGDTLRIDRARLANPRVEAALAGRIMAGRPEVTLSARLADLGVLLPEFPGPLTVAGRAAQGGQGVTLDLRARGPGGIDARLSGQVDPSAARADLRLEGTAQAALANPALDPRSLTGRLGFDLALRGALSPAAVSGRVTLGEARLADTATGLALQDLSAIVTFGQGRAQVAATAALSIGGRLRLDGAAGLAAPHAGDLTLALQGLTLRDPDLFETVADGTLRLAGPLVGGARISGRLALGVTEVRIPSTGFGADGALPGLRHAGDAAAVRATRARAGLDGAAQATGGAAAGPAYPLDLVIEAPGRIFLRGRGLDAELGGRLRLGGTTAAVVPEGAFSLIRGRLDILGKRLTLATAEIALQGGFVPIIDIAAEARGAEVTSIVRIEGPADAPEVRFTSDPELPQEEVLAQLLFGRGLQSISALQAAQLASAVATLAGRGGEGILGRLRAGIGLDDLDVKTAEDGSTSVTAGKYISERVYTEVEVGQGGQTRLNLNLDVREGLTLRGRVAADGSTGLGLFLQKDY
jgi:translocation and assembly module TamB